MSNEFKCPEGWESVPIARLRGAYLDSDAYQFWGGDDFDYIALRRKKQKPMPEILPGYSVCGRLRWYSVARQAGDHIRWIDEFGNTSYEVSISGVTAIKDRDGVMIWERER